MSFANHSHPEHRPITRAESGDIQSFSAANREEAVAQFQEGQE